MASESILSDNERLILELAPDDMVRLFDSEARSLLGMSGREAYRRIQTGAGGDDNAWSHLGMMFYLLPPAPQQWPS